jgi:ABC-type Mn2+/Zn2+ transport system ATPase subunit
MMEILRFEDVTVRYGATPALERVSFSVAAGARVAVVGPNGAGKSTLFRAVMGIAPLDGGRVVCANDQRKGSIGYLTQRSQVDWSFPVSVFDVVRMGRVGQMGWLRWPTSADDAIVRRCLEQVGMLPLAGRQIGELSGGQQQRVFIARALAQEARLLLMDEPFSGVDAPAQELILTLIDQLSAAGITILVSTHDINLAVERFDQLALLNRRLIAYGPPREAITRETLTRAYGGQAVWDGENYVMVMGDVACCGAAGENEKS